MIAELLRTEQVAIGLSGDLRQAVAQLLKRSSIAERQDMIQGVLDRIEPGDRSVIVEDGVALPHVALEGLTRPELLLGLAPRGLDFGGERITVVALLLAPAAESEQFLQLLQRLRSLLPGVRKELCAARDPRQVQRLVAAAEKQPGRATYLNLTEAQVAFELHTDPVRGLDEAEAVRRRRIHGPNRLERRRRTSWYLSLLRCLFSFFALLLWVAAALCFFPGVALPQLGFAIIAVIVVNGAFAWVQEQRSDRAVEMLESFLTHRCRVTREGRTREIDAVELVPGDVVVLSAGDVVPADARLIEAFEVEVDNSTLTGESTSSKRYKSDRAVLIEGRFLWIELPNVVFAGATVVRGEGRAIVIGTGMQTEIGRIAGLTQAIVSEESPLQRQLRATVVTIAALAGGLGLAFLFVGWLGAGLSFAQALVFCIGLFVANVPEGLLPTVTLSLAMGVTRMARRNALVKHLTAVETLGSTTVICCDKTGTLTQNVMMVTELAIDGRRVEVSGSGYSPEGRLMIDGRALGHEEILGWPALSRLIECASVCNNAKLALEGSEWRIAGDPTEGALLTLASKAALPGAHVRLAVRPFESIRKRMSVLARSTERGESIVFVKGAPLETLERCTRVQRDGATPALDDAERKRIRSEHDALASRGLRVLALAYREAGDADATGDTDLEVDLVFCGLAALSDPIRSSVPAAIEACHAAGIRVLMVTGDHALTAASIGRQVGIGRGGALRAYAGTEIAELDDAALAELLRSDEVIFSRVSPEHKLRIVSALQGLGEVVAVTGDGVNDAPALKQADIGIAMGLRGSDVAREAADMVLLDDEFGSIVAAIEEGRAVFDNIKRFVSYVLNSNPQELYPYVFWILFPGTPLAMTVMGVLAVDVGTDLIPAMGLGIEPPEAGIMSRPPRRKDERLLSPATLARAYLVQGSILAWSCYATYCWFGWTIGAWRPGLPLSAMPGSPADLDLRAASPVYLQSLTAYFFPTVTTQAANVLCKRSIRTSLFARDFLSPSRRREILDAIARWRLPLGPWTSRFFARHPILLNFVSNPLIDLGIVFGFALCWAFFYTPLSRLYYFAPVPWHVYIFACHGAVLLFAIEEAKKYFRRRGYPLTFLG